jgi:5,10-methylene-tetrahydrofolate dehydrogenase/methenyl tetrahydrofolate cyclohydrolase
MNQLTNKTVSVAGAGSIVGRPAAGDLMNALIKALIKLGILKEDLDYYLIRAAMVIIFLFFGYQKWLGFAPPRRR